MRFPLRALKRHHVATAVAVAVASATVVAGGITLASTEANAAAPAPAVMPAYVAQAKAAPFTASEKSALMLREVEAMGLELYAAQQQAVAAHNMQVREKIVSVARAQLGDRYSAGGTGPNRFDCSGLTKYVYKQVTGKDLPHQSHSQYAIVKKIKKKDARPGDLVFFFGGGAHHVGIYIGNGKMIDAVGYGSGVRVSPISGDWWGRTYTGMGRILPA